MGCVASSALPPSVEAETIRCEADGEDGQIEQLPTVDKVTVKSGSQTTLFLVRVCAPNPTMVKRIIRWWREIPSVIEDQSIGSGDVDMMISYDYTNFKDPSVDFKESSLSALMEEVKKTSNCDAEIQKVSDDLYMLGERLDDRSTTSSFNVPIFVHFYTEDCVAEKYPTYHSYKEIRKSLDDCDKDPIKMMRGIFHHAVPMPDKVSLAWGYHVEPMLLALRTAEKYRNDVDVLHRRLFRYDYCWTTEEDIDATCLDYVSLLFREGANHSVDLLLPQEPVLLSARRKYPWTHYGTPEFRKRFPEPWLAESKSFSMCREHVLRVSGKLATKYERYIYERKGSWSEIMYPVVAAAAEDEYDTTTVGVMNQKLIGFPFSWTGALETAPAWEETVDRFERSVLVHPLKGTAGPCEVTEGVGVAVDTISSASMGA